MTVGEIMEIEEKLGKRLTQQEIEEIETKRKMEIKSYANKHGYTDVEPYEVLKTISPICVEIRAMNVVQNEKIKKFNKV